MQFNDLLAHDFTSNIQVIGRLTEGLTHADSLAQPPFAGNCINWLLGHIVVSRTRVQKLIGLTPTWNDAQTARYETGTDPITGDGDGVIALEDLLAALDETAESIAARLRDLSDADLDVVPDGSERSLGFRLHGLHWHETYHIGQLELLRVVAGKTEKLFG
jgi:hypothetical protein